MNVPVQVTPLLLELIADNVPLAAVISSLELNPVTASLNVSVTSDVSPVTNAVSSILKVSTVGDVPS